MPVEGTQIMSHRLFVNDDLMLVNYILYFDLDPYLLQ